MNTTTQKDTTGQGWLNGFIGMLIFSASLPATKVAIIDFDPIFLTLARATIAGLLALIALLIFKQKRPDKDQLFSLFIAAIGVVVGFPLLTALALQYITSAHSLVFIGILPVSTAIFGIIRGGERPKPIFWLFAILGSLLVVAYAISQGISSSPMGDLLMFGAIVLCGLGYAEGAKLTKTLGGWQVISWALLLSLPLMMFLAFIYMPISFEGISGEAWLGLAYVSLFSMFIGFIFWYKG